MTRRPPQARGFPRDPAPFASRRDQCGVSAAPGGASNPVHSGPGALSPGGKREFSALPGTSSPTGARFSTYFSTDVENSGDSPNATRFLRCRKGREGRTMYHKTRPAAYALRLAAGPRRHGCCGRVAADLEPRARAGGRQARSRPTRRKSKAIESSGYVVDSGRMAPLPLKAVRHIRDSPFRGFADRT